MKACRQKAKSKPSTLCVADGEQQIRSSENVFERQNANRYEWKQNILKKIKDGKDLFLVSLDDGTLKFSFILGTAASSP